MGKEFDRVAIALTPGGTEYVILESQIVLDFGEGQGPRGGVVTVKGGWVTIQGAGEARLDGGQEEQGGTFPPHLTLKGKGKLAVEIAAHEAPDATVNPSKATVYLEGASATLRMRDANGNDHTLLDGAKGDLWLGGKAAAGDVMLFKSGETDNRNIAKATIDLDGNTAGITLKYSQQERIFLDGTNGDVWLGGKNVHGDIMLYHKDQQENRDPAKATIRLAGAAGQITMRNAAGKDGIVFDGNNGFTVRDHAGKVVLNFAAEGGMVMRDAAGADSIVLDRKAGDIVLANADCAEDFDVAEAEEVEPGTVMVLDQEGRLQKSKEAYDKKVAGVISGAGGYKPSIILGRQCSQHNRMPVSLVGKAYCKADAQYAPIEVGALLTTSSTAGHAMKVDDPQKAFGAVLGKALRPLRRGRGLIPILIALQ